VGLKVRGSIIYKTLAIQKLTKMTNLQLIFLSILTAIFPGGLGFGGTRMPPFWILLDEGGGVSTGAIIDVQSSSQITTNNKPTLNFLHAGWSSCHPTNSVKALKDICS